MTSDTRREDAKFDKAKEEGQHLSEEARQKGSEVGEQARQEMGRVVDDVRHKARQQADDQTKRAAGALRDASDQLNSMAEGATSQGMLIDLTRDGAERLGRFADQLEHEGLQGVVDDVERFARRRPGMFIAAGVGVGMVLGRVIKASGSAMQQDGSRYDRDAQAWPETQAPLSTQTATRPIGSPSPTEEIGRRGVGI